MKQKELRRPFPPLQNATRCLLRLWRNPHSGPWAWSNLKRWQLDRSLALGSPRRFGKKALRPSAVFLRLPTVSEKVSLAAMMMLCWFLPSFFFPTFKDGPVCNTADSLRTNSHFHQKTSFDLKKIYHIF